MDPRFLEGLRWGATRVGARGGGRGARGGAAGFGFGGAGGFPFGFGGFPFGRRAGRARRGDIRAGILALLAESPRNGYQIMQELTERSRGMWRPSPGSVYPALQQLQDEGLVRSEEAGTGRVFQLTDAGRKYIEEHQAETEAPWDWATNEIDEELFDLMGQIRHIAAALWQISSSGQADQIAQARKVLTDAKRALYRILSEEPEEEPANEGR
jgi:DNA-binding PadR family transcriptional regulator